MNVDDVDERSEKYYGSRTAVLPPRIADGGGYVPDPKDFVESFGGDNGDGGDGGGGFSYGEVLWEPELATRHLHQGRHRPGTKLQQELQLAEFVESHELFQLRMLRMEALHRMGYDPER